MPRTLSAEQQATFDREGYLVLRGALDPERDLEPIMDEFAGVLDRLATELFAAGEISSPYAGFTFSDRLTRVYAESGKVHAQYFDCSLPQAKVRADTPFWTGPAVFALLRNPAILDAVESLIGTEIYANPVQHVRIKPPEHLTPVNPETGQVQLGATAWHQDNGVVTEDADETDIITVWLPLTAATQQNGCLVVQPRGHREGLLPHCPFDSGAANKNGGAGLHIPAQYLGEDEHLVTLPMAAGDVLLMHRRTPHASHSNTSDHVRWSFDLRYNPIGHPTGRSAFPGFVARSAANPTAELHDPKAWTRLWLETRSRLAEAADPRFNRWDAADQACA
ncbi:MAG: phytanoyl-CoA dioxygenase family protein [Chloroflexia bacterium]|nr:phytanoyl-CoA dioxygenase family protein [Chloroflexia bacterium]MDQ3412625.1 phytanoyl-CoA dioxygenase family protein [Chloroflexota bacterium]